MFWVFEHRNEHIYVLYYFVWRFIITTDLTGLEKKIPRASFVPLNDLALLL